MRFKRHSNGSPCPPNPSASLRADGRVCPCDARAVFGRHTRGRAWRYISPLSIKEKGTQLPVSLPHNDLLGLAEVGAELLASARVAEPADRFFFDLANALAGKIKLLANLFERQ